MTVYCLWTLGSRRAEYKCRSRTGAWTSIGRQRSTSCAVRLAIQSPALRPPPYRRPLLDFGDVSDFHSRAPPKDDQTVVTFCALEYSTVYQCRTRKLGSCSESALPRGPRQLGVLLPSTSPRRILPFDDYEHYRGRLQEMLDQLVRLDATIQDLLEDGGIHC